MRFLNAPAIARERGLTLVELMITVSIAGILLVTGLPMFGEYVANSRLREGGNTLLTDALFAQSEAIKRNGKVTLKLLDASLQVVDVGTDTVLRSRALPEGVSAGSTTITFDSSGRLTPFGTEPSPIGMSMSGVTCSDDRRCPALQVESGGAIRLCGNKLNCS